MKMRSHMKILIVSVVTAAALLAMATNFRPSHLHSTIGRAGMSGTSELQDMQSARSDKLPVEDFEDRSLVFPRETKH
jgi:hypothetical protein